MTVGSGSQWGEIFALANEKNIGLVGGNFKSVSVEGHVSGGGHGLLSAKYGLAADNVLEITLVNANGEAIVATSARTRSISGQCVGYVNRSAFQYSHDMLKFSRAVDPRMEWLCPTLFKAFDQGHQLCTAPLSMDGTKLLTCIPNGQRSLSLVVAATFEDIQGRVQAA